MESQISCGGVPLRIAVFYNSEAVFGEKSSGAGVYEVALSKVLARVRDETGIEIVNFVPAAARRHKARNRKLHGDLVKQYRKSFAEKLFLVAPSGVVARIIARLGLLGIRETLLREKVHCAYFASPNSVALILEDIPYITTEWDLGHRDLPGFPEVWAQSLWLARERRYSTVLPRASCVMVDSATTGAKLEKYYGIGSDRWEVVGLLPNVQIPENPQKEIDGPYIIYPAMKWPHKNHRTLLEAFALVLKTRPEFKLVLTGSDKGNAAKINAWIDSLGIQNSVVDLGFVSRDKVINLIFHAEILVMPSLLGPTNLPPLEALSLGTKTIVSSVHDFGLGDLAGLTVAPPWDASGWANTIEQVLSENAAPPPPISFPSEGAFQVHVNVFSQLSRERESW